MAISFPATSTSATVLNSSAVTITKPTSATTGDLLVAMVMSTKSTAVSAGSFTWPSGWTLLDADHGGSSGNMGYEVRWHIVAAGESTYSVTADSNTTGSSLYLCSAYRGTDTTTPFVQHGQSGVTTGGGTATSATLTDSTSGLWRVSFFAGHTVNSAVYTFGSYSPADTQRVADARNSDTYRPIGATVDSNGTVNASGGTSGAATTTGGGTVGTKAAWTGLLQPPFAAPSTYDSCGVLVAF